MSKHLPLLWQIGLWLIWVFVGTQAQAQLSGSNELPPPINSQPAANNLPTADMNVLEVRIEGHTPNTQIGRLPKLQTRAGTPFDAKLIEEDVRALDRTRRFIDIRPRYQQLNNGIVVIFQVVEKPIIRYIKFIGMSGVAESKLKKEAGLEIGEALDPHRVKEAQRAMESYYHENGFPEAYVEIKEGDKLQDRGVVFLVNEGLKQSYWSTVFEGNQIATDARLKTQIESKPGFMYLFGGKVDHQKIDNDVAKLTSYYRSLGFFQAKVSRIIETADDGWTTLRFIIYEGPRYKVRNITTIGQAKFTQEQLLADQKLKPNEYFDQPKLDADLAKIRDIYGGEGHIYCDVQADTRFAEEPGILDIVYRVSEGAIYRVGEVKVDINGENPHTRYRTVMNRMSLRPGDIVDTRKMRTDEIRLRRSQLFQNDPSKGAPPRIVITAPDNADEKAKELARNGVTANGKPRFQSPDPEPNVVYVDIVYQGTPNEQGPWLHINQDSYWISLEQQVQADLQQHAGPHSVVQPPVAPIPATFAPAATYTQPTTFGASNQPMSLPNAATTTIAPTGRIHLVRYTPMIELQREATAQPAVRNPHAPALPATEQPRLQRTAEPAIRVRAQSPDPFATVPGVVNPNTNYNPAAYTTQPAAVPANWGAQPAVYQTNPNYGPADYAVQPVQFTQPAPDVAPAYPTTGPNGFVNAPTTGIAPTPEVIPPGPAFGAPAVPQSGQPGPGQPFTDPAGQPPTVITPFDNDPNSWMNNPSSFVDINGIVTEGQTGRLMFGVGVNSNAGVVGNIVLDEQNFDIRRLPRSWADLWSGQAWRGAGQRFRIEASPGTQVSRYAISFTEPYLFDTPISFSTSGSYYERQFRDWFEDRISGRFGLGYQLPYRPDWSISAKFRIENIGISDPRNPAPQELLDIVGQNDLYGFGLGLTHDTRDSPFLPTEGWFMQFEAEYVTGSFNYPRSTLELRRYFTLAQRADGSGRHVLGIGGDFGITGPNTPIYDNFFAGGFSTLRGFRFRGASPIKNNVIVGGELQLLGTAEYMFPITADDTLRGVLFCDFGTVEEKPEIDMKNFRVAPGFGMRINIAAMGPAPIALDFAFPISDAEGDQQQVFTFFMGIAR